MALIKMMQNTLGKDFQKAADVFHDKLDSLCILVVSNLILHETRCLEHHYKRSALIHHKKLS